MWKKRRLSLSMFRCSRKVRVNRPHRLCQTQPDPSPHDHLMWCTSPSLLLHILPMLPHSNPLMCCVFVCCAGRLALQPNLSSCDDQPVWSGSSVCRFIHKTARAEWIPFRFRKNDVVIGYLDSLTSSFRSYQLEYTFCSTNFGRFDGFAGAGMWWDETAAGRD